jgi:hypothetical protein
VKIWVPALPFRVFGYAARRPALPPYGVLSEFAARSES